MMGRTELCQWLRDNSSGIYRPAAEAADEIEMLVKAKDSHFQHAMLNGAAANEARAEADAFRKDAARYRWLRDFAPIRSEPVPFVCGLNDLALWGDECDAATDAAMKAYGAVGAA